MSGDKVDALVIFGATGDLAKLETFPAPVGLVERGVLDVPVVGVAKSGWSLDQFCDYAVDSLKLNNMDPGTPAAKRMLDLLHYVDRGPRRSGDLPGDVGHSRTVGAAGAVLPRSAAVRELDRRADAQQELRAVRPDHDGRGLHVADRGSLRWLQTLSIGNAAISVFRRNDAFRDRLPQLEVLYWPPSADTHADPVSGIATTP
jgi:hypothetical protein